MNLCGNFLWNRRVALEKVPVEISVDFPGETSRETFGEILKNVLKNSFKMIWLGSF